MAFRLWLALGSTSRTDSDQAIVGLMALQLLRHGHMNAFFWKQSYGGGLEAFAVAPSLAVFGTNTLGLVFPSVVFGLIAAWLSWRIARRFFSPLIAAASGILSLFWPAASVWFGTRERGFYPLTAMLGLLMVLTAVRINDEPKRTWRWVILGASVGVGWWMSPNIVYYAVPMSVWLLVRGHWRQWLNILASVVSAFAGSTVWWYANLHSHFASLQQPPWAGSTTYLDRFKFFWSHAFPFALGLRRPWLASWVLSAAWANLLYIGILVTIAVATAISLKHRAAWAGSPDLVLLVASPFIFAAFVGNWHLYEGRYEYFLASILPLVMCRAMTLRAGRALLAVIATVGMWSFVRLDIPRFTKARLPSTVPIGRALQAAGYRTAIGDHWVAYQLTFESDERVIATRLPSPRYDAYANQVRASRPALVYRIVRNHEQPQLHLMAFLRAHHIGFRTLTAGGYFAVLPESQVLP
ncbi:MAG TPA: glycosyltransferase family 39 protein [Acidimicrobiia bacterium]|nr:glycosyltransferase family 39 protein [Acidimicrobiia bacterium]